MIQMCNQGHELLTSHFTGKEVSAQSCGYSCLSIFIYVLPFKEIQTIGKVHVGFFFLNWTTHQCYTLHIHCICESSKKFSKGGVIMLISQIGKDCTFKSPEEGNGYPLQYSCLENAMYREPWRAAVHGVAKNQTPLSNWNTHMLN